jgi:hypothetical protein
MIDELRDHTGQPFDRLAPGVGFDRAHGVLAIDVPVALDACRAERGTPTPVAGNVPYKMEDWAPLLIGSVDGILDAGLKVFSLALRLYRVEQPRNGKAKR